MSGLPAICTPSKRCSMKALNHEFAYGSEGKAILTDVADARLRFWRRSVLVDPDSWHERVGGVGRTDDTDGNSRLLQR